MAINQLIIVVSFVPHWNGKFKVVPVHPIFKHIFVGSQTWLAGKFDMCPHLHFHFVQTMRNKERFGISCSHMFPNVFHHWITTWGISRFWSKHVKTICTAPLGPVSPAWYFLSNFPFDCLVDGYEGVVCWKTAVVFSFVCNTRFGPQYLLLTSLVLQTSYGIWRTCQTNVNALKEVSCWKCVWLVAVSRPAACNFFWASVSVRSHLVKTLKENTCHWTSNFARYFEVYRETLPLWLKCAYQPRRYWFQQLASSDSSNCSSSPCDLSLSCESSASWGLQHDHEENDNENWSKGIAWTNHVRTGSSSDLLPSSSRPSSMERMRCRSSSNSLLGQAVSSPRQGCKGAPSWPRRIQGNPKISTTVLLPSPGE